MSGDRWQFWIDVGGTFTDCVARRPDGTLVRTKLLSSGVTKGSVGQNSTAKQVASPIHEQPDSFWSGYQFQLLNDDGSVVAQSIVASSSYENRTLQLANALDVLPQPGQTYELTSGELAPIVALRMLLGLRLDQPIPSVAVRLGTTRGTNALLTRNGARTAFVTTTGFGDILRIGYQNRPRLFDLAIKKPRPLFEQSIEIQERVSADGEVLVAPNREEIRVQLQKLREDGIESLAICLMHAYRQKQHEELLEQIAHEIGFQEVSISSRVAPFIKIVSRGDTTVVDAYLTPVLREYVATLRRSLGATSELRLVTSAGGLNLAEQFSGKDSILSGPAGGVVGFSRVAQAAGFQRAIGFDMGGTSTDVSRFDGRFELEYETEKAGVRIVTPMMAIETVAAGGGSVCWFDGVKLCVGPQSAGADPGPLCYGRGGPLTVTDMNLFLGKVLPDQFPFPLQPTSLIEQRLVELRDEVAKATGTHFTPIELADGFLQVANANMAKAIRSISIAKGYDPSDYVLVAFGGAAPQHACAIAEELGISKILNHPDSGILSALGAGMADIVRHEAVGVYASYSAEALTDLESTFDQLVQTARDKVLNEGIAAEWIEVNRSIDLRFQGLDAYLSVPCPADGDYRAAFLNEHQKLYGYIHEDRSLEIVTIRIEAIGRSTTRLPASQSTGNNSAAVPSRVTQAFFDGLPVDTNIYHRSKLQPGNRITGPAIVLEDVSTTAIDPGWSAEVLSQRELLLQAVEDKETRRRRGGKKTSDVGSLSPPLLVTHSPLLPDSPSPILLEIFNNHFAGIAEQMGITLRNTASSVNVKERLDFSCALFTATGDLVVNAPHIPVHLGAMGETVKRVIADNTPLQPGDVIVTNDPYRGGSHLPDVTVVTPVHDEATSELRFFTASRAHHAEIGGITPGSMPPFSKNLAEEGVLIRNFKLVEAGRSRVGALRELLLAGPFPTRKVEDNLADIAAQVAANRQGVRDLSRLVERYTWPVVAAYMQHIQAAAEQKTRNALSQFPDGRHHFIDHLDDGSPIEVTITVKGGTATIDFTGTGPVLPGNLNANRAIVTAAVMYCLRCLINEDIPLNQGVLAPIEIVLPTCLLNPPEGDSPEQSAAVVGGNVETSQRVVDVLLGAFGIAAASQGTMNNLLFGDESFGYYETICGGSGATVDSNGADAVHTHMTNTRLTDPEILEQRYPVRLRQFAIRRGSGGAGEHHGGDGVVRQIEFLKPLVVSTICQRRGEWKPYGVAGGESGQAGANSIRYVTDENDELSGSVQLQVNAGDTLTIETPGGGGFGKLQRLRD
ncbi:MAG: hydantoinase B/oxoprolinase family protein [Planctomycetales bacterium]|nr:hydantoinase B/oxoprolinase family protein [Planctomycetales bacterium]